MTTVDQIPNPGSVQPVLSDDARRRRRQRRITKSYPYLFMFPALALVFVVFAYPIFQGFIDSLHEETLTGADRRFVGVQVYQDLFERREFWNSMNRSVIFVLGTIFGGTALAVIFALTLFYVPYFKRALRVLSLVPWLVSGIAVAWIFRFLFNTDVGLISRITDLIGLDIGTWLGSADRAIWVVILANTWYLVPFGSLLLLAGLQMMDQEMFQAAKVDGAASRQLFRFITLPQLKPHIGIVLVVFSFAAWNTFDLVLAMTEGGPRASTEILGVYMYKRAFRALEFGEGAALMVVILLINVVLSVAYLFWLKNDD